MAEKVKKEKKRKVKKCSTYIGGQAVLEGVMMQGKTCMATSVRDPEGTIQTESLRLKKGNFVTKASKIPFVRGTVNLVLSLVRGTKTLMRAAAVYGEDEEEESGKMEKWLADKFQVSLMDVVTWISVFVGVLLALGIFILVPNLLVNWLSDLFPSALRDSELAGLWTSLIFGGLKLVILLAYLSLVLLLKDIRRLYMYHGAEHKTINAYEHGVELTPENVKKCSRLHDRCGTSFIFIVVIIDVLVFSVIAWLCRIDKSTIPNGALFVLARLALGIVLLPFIAGISYEILKFLAKFDNKFVLIFKAPGMLLQKCLTTREPDEEMIEVAIASFKKVLEMDADQTVPETKFVTSGVLSKMLEETKRLFAENNIDESDAEWIYSLVLGIKRSELNEVRTVKASESKKIDELVQKRLTGRPLWYIVGDTEFCGCKIKVDERALIPRSETELLADDAIKSVEEGYKVLDMCTGSGCIAVAIAAACKDKNVSVTAADVSDAAIMLAEENAKLNGVKINFIKSDLFSNVRGRFDLIVCNPPYVKSGEIPSLQREVREYEPKVALDGGEDGLEFYRRLASEINHYIAKDGMLIMECGEGQASAIMQMFKKREYAVIMKDFAGVDRFVKIVF